MATNTCVSCGAEIPDGGHVCPNCELITKPKVEVEYVFDPVAAAVMFTSGLAVGVIITFFIYLATGGV